MELNSFAANNLVLTSHLNYFSSTYLELDIQARMNPLELNRDLINHYAMYLSIAEGIPVNDVIRDFIHFREFNGVRSLNFSLTILNFEDYVREVGLPESVNTRFWNEYVRNLSPTEVEHFRTAYNIVPRLGS